MNSHIIKIFTGITLCTLIISSCAKDSGKLPQPGEPANVLKLARQESDLKLFVAAAEAAGIENRLQEGASYTLLAPTDSSFRTFLNARGLATIQDLQNQMGTGEFETFVSYHFLEKKVMAENISSGYVLTFARSAQDDRLHSYMTRNDMKITINGTATVQRANITGEGGVVHKVNEVLTPLTLEGLARVNPKFSKLNIAIDFAGGSLPNILNDNTGFHTLFAPTDGAFNTFLNYYGYMDINTLLNLIGPAQIEDAIKYHLIKGHFKAEDFQNTTYQTLLAGASLSLSKDSSGTILILDDKGNPLVKIITTNIMAVNGVMHTIDQVLEYE